MNEEEISRFFENLPNLKHRALLMAAYGTGMRVSEVASLRVADIDSDRMMICIEQKQITYGRVLREITECGVPSRDRASRAGSTIGRISSVRRE